MALIQSLRSGSNHLRAKYHRSGLSGLAVTHSSWFKLEDQGMSDYELLARGSAFYVRGPSTGAIFALVSAHVAAPHHFRNYFPQKWLEYVRDLDCHSIWEGRSQDGSSITCRISTQPLISGFRHASLDVAAFPLADDELNCQKDIPILELSPEDTTPALRDQVTIAGFRLAGQSGSGTEAVIRTEINGTVSEVRKSRIFVDTGHLDTEMGMCGGPVVMMHNRLQCVGLLEGLVPRVTSGFQYGETHKRLQGKSVLVRSNELRKLVHDVETEIDNAKS